MNTTKHIFRIFILLLASQKLYAQVDSVYTGRESNNDKRKPKQHSEKIADLKDKLVYGGMIMPGFYATTFGNVLSVNANGSIGYRITERLTAGVEGNFTYTSIKTSYGTFQESVYGPGIFARYKIFQSSFLQAQYSKLNQPNYYTGYDKRIWVDYLLVGGGYFQRISNEAGFITSVLFNLSPNSNSIYRSPVFQVGFTTNF